jgi:hypothetical protein
MQKNDRVENIPTKETAQSAKRVARAVKFFEFHPAAAPPADHSPILRNGYIPPFRYVFLPSIPMLCVFLTNFHLLKFSFPGDLFTAVSAEGCWTAFFTIFLRELFSRHNKKTFISIVYRFLFSLHFVCRSPLQKGSSVHKNNDGNALQAVPAVGQEPSNNGFSLKTSFFFHLAPF